MGKIYVIRRGAWDPRDTRSAARRFSCTIGEMVDIGKKRPAAVYRVSGPASNPGAVDVAAREVARVLNGVSVKTVPEIRKASPRGIQITCTTAGRDAGFQ